MSYKIEKTKDDNILNIAFEIEYKDLFEKIKEVYNEQKHYVQVPGFRKGKVPFEIAIKTYGEEVFYDEAVNKILPGLYEEALIDSDIRVIAPPKVEYKKLEKGENVLIDCKIYEIPKISIPKEKDIEIEPIEKEIVSEEKVNDEIKKEVDKNVRIVPIKANRKLKKGDLAIIDFTGYIDNDGEKGERISGGTAENYSLEIGSNSFIPGFEENLIGMQKGDEQDIFLNFPKEYHEASLANKPVIFTVKLHEIKEKEYPEIDDEFAKDQGFDNLEEYKESIKKDLENVIDEKYREELLDVVNKEVVDIYDVKLSDEALTRAAESEVHQMEHMFSNQGFSLSQYLQMINMKYADFLNDIKKRKELEIKSEAIYVALYKNNKEKVDKYIENLSKEDKEKFEEILNKIGITKEAKEAAKNDKIAQSNLKYAEETAKIKYYVTKNVKFKELKNKDKEKAKDKEKDKSKSKKVDKEKANAKTTKKDSKEITKE